MNIKVKNKVKNRIFLLLSGFRNRIFLLLWVIQTLYVVLSIFFPFFWDAVYHAQVALHVYEHEFNTIFPDPDIDAGHPTLFNVYLALVWKIFGKTIWISHLAQLPFVWGYVYFVYQCIDKYIDKSHQWIAVLLLSAEATLTAQLMSLNPDIALLCAFFMTLHGINTQQSKYIISGMILLSLLSIRGWIMGIALGIIDFAENGFDLKLWKKYLTRYILFVLCIVIWLFTHHYYTGRWFASQMYASEFSWKIIPKNIAVFVFRLIDTGRIILWILLFIFVFKLRKNISILLSENQFFIRSIIIVLGTFFILFIPLTNPIGHRYFMVVYVLAILWIVQMASVYKVKNRVFLLVGLCLISGHFWVYPVPIANGWDASLAHIPYFKVKDEVLEYAKKNNISYTKIYTYPPLHKSDYYTRLSPIKEAHLPLLDEHSQDAPYILYSNISNHFNRKELNRLKEHYIAMYQKKMGYVEVILYQKK